MFGTSGTSFKVPFFRWGTIVSSDGFSVRIEDRSALRYEEQGRSMLITVDAGGGGITIFHGSMRWDDAPDILLDAATDRRITENICRALEWRGYSVDLVT